MTQILAKPRKVAKAKAPAVALRINARLDDAHAEQLRFLMAERQCNATEALKFAIERGYEELRGSRASKRAMLDALVGAFSGGPPDLASRYKQHFAESLIEKNSKGRGAKGRRGHR